ncbi:MAG: hypothetical protein KGJ80_06940 [Chloroflexota bacterium]|nr:hypothetical protein [Chloroflexota bacterium]
MSKRSIRFLLRSIVVLSVVLSAMFVFAGGSSAQGPSGASKIPPITGANAVPTSPDLDQLAQSIAQQLGFDPQYAYEVWAIPGATWDSTFKYYSDQIAALGWKDPGIQGDFQTGVKMGNFLNADTKSGISLVFVPKEAGGVLYVVSGSAASKAAAAANRVDSKGKLNPDGSFATSGQYIADLGFRPDSAGFPFQNYGAGNYTNLTPAEVRRVFGDQACQSLQDNKCILQPQIQEIMDKWNKSMEGGHCYGFSAASLRFYVKQINSPDFGGNTIPDLTLDGNEKLQREIAYSFIGQYLPPVKDSRISGTPNDVLDKLIGFLKAGSSATETYTIGFFKADGNGGHAVTPYAVEDLGGGINAVLVYDNNWPKVTRAILFDRNTNKWSYDAAINPQIPSELYWGNADTQSLFLYPTNPGTKQLAQNCPYCVDRGGRVTGLAAPALTQKNTIILTRNPGAEIHLLITDASGKRYGYLSDGTFVTEIPGVTIDRPMVGGVNSWNESAEPVYYVPADLKFTLTIDGSLLKDTDVASVDVIGPGYDIGVEDINMDPKQKDTLTPSPDGTQISYKTDSSESPDIIAAIENATSTLGYSFLVKGVDVEGGGTINVALDPVKGQLKLNTSGTKNAGTYGLMVNRYDDKGEQTFWHDSIALGPTDTAYLDYGKWTGNKANLSLGIDRNSVGTIAETLDLTDTEPSTSVPKPAAMANAKALTPTADITDLAGGVADAAGFTNFTYEASQLPAGSTWQDAFAYYSQQMTQLGWADKPTQDEFEDGRIGEWINPANDTGLAVYYSSSPYDNAPPFVIAVYGVATPVATPKSEWKPVDKSADLDKTASGVANTFGFGGYVYQPWSLPAATTWEDVFKYYNDQMKQEGWSGDGTTQDLNGNKIGAWIDPDTKLGTVLVFVPSPDGTKPPTAMALVGLSAVVTPSAPSSSATPAATATTTP